ncbi:MAG: D-tyrosyl-tRNA(Tyr) deacylase [Bacteroidetes bacterium]|nr:D-tyrosyl-tRNA(Tyr) deacylase [Bacteroidota bacterium]
MRVVIQRVSEAKVVIDGTVSGEIGLGYVLLLGIEDADTEQDVDWLVRKVTALRVFSDDEGRMNLSINDVGGNVLVISQFTLHASYKKGNRPGFTKAARPDKAIPLYESFLQKMETSLGKKIASGRFGADMKIHLINDGPVTISMDSQNPE